MAPSVEKKIAELEMGLLHLQQNIDIPEITLTIHPTVVQITKKCSEENRKPKINDFGDRVDDAHFLNALQNGVNKWIKEIQKVRASVDSSYLLKKEYCIWFVCVDLSATLLSFCARNSFHSSHHTQTKHIPSESSVSGVCHRGSVLRTP